MKLYLFTICTLFFTTSLLAQNVNIPDAIFKEYLLTNTAINTNGDREISVAEAEAFTGGIYVNSKGINDLTGIEAFIKLTKLQCERNSLYTLDVSKNTELTELVCAGTELSSLDVSKNTALTWLACSWNYFTTLDVSKNTALHILWCGGSLTTLDVSKNTALESLDCSWNYLVTLDVSKNTALTWLYCNGNTLSTLDVSKNTALTTLNCSSNTLNTLDVSKNKALAELICDDNTLNALDVSKNTALTWLYCNNNTLATLDVSNNIALETLHCYINTLTTLDVSNNIALETLHCYINTLTTLDVSNNTALTKLNCFGNTLSSLDVSNNIALKALYCSDTQLASLDVSKNIALTELYCSDNTLTTLDISNNIALTDLDCKKNTLTTLDISKNTALTDLDCNKNTLTTLDVSKNTALKTLNCSGTLLASIDVSKNTSLTEFNCYNNTLTALDVSNNKALISLDCSNNTLATLDLRNGKNTALKTFLVTNNPNLYCISVDDVAWATDNWKSIDSHATFNINCFENYFQAIFKTDTLIGETPLPVKFTDQSSGIPTTWFWDFGDGTNATTQHSEHNFTKPGNYTVRLRVTKDADTSNYSQKITALWPAAVREKINPFAGKARSGAVSFVIDTLAYVGLGRNADSCFADMWQFNPLTDTWTDVAPFPGEARSGAVAFVLNTEVYVGLGGNQVSSTLYNDFYSYNPKENTWKQVADFGGTARSNAVAFAIGDTAYVGTGTDSEGATKNFWKYNPGTNQWTEITGFTGDARSGAVGFEIDGKGYVSGGQDFGFQLSDIQEYNPETGKWKEKIFADANLTFNRATVIGVGKTAFICYGDKKKVVSYTPHTNKIEDLGDVLNFEDVREDAVSFFLYGAAYFGLGVTYGDFSDNYAAHYKNDIQHIDLPFVFEPEDILLSNNTITENSPEGTVIGVFSTVEKNDKDTFTYELTSESNLYIENELLKAMATNYEIDSVYNINVKTTGSDGFTFEKAFTIKVKDINEAPWKLEIAGDTVLSGAPIGTLVGNFKAYDEDTTDTHIFRFDASRSNIDTTFYNIIGDSLLVAGTINKDDLMHDFYVLAIDKGGLELSQQIFIDIIEGVGIRMVESAVNLFDIYPNPVGDVLTIQSKNHEQIITELVLVNAMGKVVSKTEKVNATNHRLRTANMKAGIYFLMVRTEQGTYMQKLVKE